MFITKVKKCHKIIGAIKTVFVSVPKKAFPAIYKAFIIPHLDYGDILYDKP